MISRGGEADFRLVSMIPQERRPCQLGSLKDRIHIADDFDEPLDDFSRTPDAGAPRHPHAALFFCQVIHG